MRRAVLLYNPQSGSRHARRRAEIERVAAVFRSNRIDVALEPTAGPRIAEQQARRFIDDGFDTIIACGGDGTVNDVLQGVVNTQATLGVLPLGTANSLACDLGLKRDPAVAAKQLLSASARRIAVGQIEYQRGPLKRDSRYFTVAAGVGVDAALFYKLNAVFKQRYGMAAYTAESLRMWATHPFEWFRVEWFDTDLNQKRSEVVTQLLAVRIADFGGIVRRLAPGADLLRNDFRLVLFKTRSRTRYLRFVTGHLIGRDWQDPHIELVHASQVSCLPHRDEQQSRHAVVHAEVDGEYLGPIPATLSIVSNALDLLVPPTASSLKETP